MAKTFSSAVGIDIGTDTIKIAELRAGRDRPTLAAVAIVPTPRDGVDHNGIFEPGVVAAAIKAAFAEAGVTTKQTVMGISGQASVVVRMLEVPKMTPTELKEHMQWEIQRNIPFAETTIVSDYARVSTPYEPPDAQQMDVVLAVAPQSAIDTIVSVMTAAGLDPVGIDVQAMAISRLLCLGGADGQPPVMVVNMGKSTTSIDVYTAGLLSFPRVLPLGGDTFTQAIADSMSLTIEEAEDLKLRKAEVLVDRLGFSPAAPQPLDYAPEPQPETYQSYDPYVDVSDQGPVFEVEPDVELAPPTHEDYQPGGYDAGEPSYAPEPPPPAEHSLASYDPDTQRVFDAIMPTLEELTSEVRRSVEYFRGRGAGSEVSHILLTGRGSQMKRLPEFFEAALGLPAKPFDVINLVQLGMRRQTEDFVRTNAAALSVAIGMALHAFEE
ncbi:MAG: type IV pilus assembly protein PilM [Fimbriimonadia bacterium]|jgi:type IV pilus assembly protein PilM